MKTLVLYYSLTGHSKTLAEAYAAKKSLPISQITDASKPGKLKAYTIGCFGAIRGGSWPITTDKPLEDYERIVLFSPVWAGSTPPSVNAALSKLASGTRVDVNMVSASGKSTCRGRLETKLKSKDCSLSSFTDVKG
ncbi:hypothetical protein AGMMS49992_13530 [Clostridia bacterium]|nr:hypothetical protein AGMMS49992_13530 [Clostridia bacterium]